MKQTLYQHLTDPTSLRPLSNQIIENTRFVATGSLTGRFLFRDWTFIELAPGADNITIRNCEFIGPATAVRFQGA